jgi:hypothetical protein
LDGHGHQGNGERDPRRHHPGCSTRAFAAPDRRVIESQSVRLSANFLRSERRSTDGQVILKQTSGRSENRPDLLFCGAPLRNRTVDLLLTMHTSVGSLPGKRFPAGRRQALIWVLPRPAASATAQAIAPTAGAAVGAGLCRRVAAPSRAWPAIQARPVGLHAGQPRPLQRSKDGQTIFPIPPAQSHEDHAEQAAFPSPGKI